jgi:predicted TIM-barrel fold metal-dependent hydrolase
VRKAWRFVSFSSLGLGKIEVIRFSSLSTNKHGRKSLRPSLFLGHNTFMLIDFHTHIFPPEIQRQRERYCQRDPWFNELYSNPHAYLATAEDLIAEMDSTGVDRSVTFSFGWTDPGLIEETNSYVIEAMRRYPNRIYGMAVLQPTVGARALRELERCAQAGMIGLGELMPHGQGYSLSDIALLKPFMELVRQYQLLVLSHCSEPVGHLYPGKGNVSLADIVTFLTAFPDIRFIAAHWGGGLPFYCLMPEIQRITANVWYDTAATPYLYRNTILPAVAKMVGVERILFASDYGLLGQRRVMEYIAQSGLNSEEIAMVLGGNAQRLLRIDEPKKL